MIYLWIALFAAGMIGIGTTLILYLKSARKKNNEYSFRKKIKQ